MTVYLSRIVCNSVRSSYIKCLNMPEQMSQQCRFFSIKRDLFNLPRVIIARKSSSDAIHPTVALENSSIPLKKKIIHKKADLDDLTKKEGHYLTLAYVTANSYDLKGLKEALVQQKLYEPATLQAQEVGDVVIANAVYSVGSEPRQIIFFREGAVVFWNCTELEASNVLDLVRRFEVDSYPRDVVEKEREVMTYCYQPNAKKCYLQEEGFVLVPHKDNLLEKFTFSHAMTQSARLGAWESRLEALAAAVRQHSSLMERHGAANVDKKEIVRKLGELFSLRHQLNVESDLLDTPDLYWEQEQLERIYSSTVACFTIARRTRVLNERLAHCVELLELVSQWAADRHHVRLEWMIIALILVEVCFELLHFFERSFTTEWRYASPKRAPLPTAFEDSLLQEIFILDT
ncbi:required for meiotic nuclear division protein 1 homolog isoform X5 [Ostrinia furnacalis]|uniref:required for meiotic nuclear division protein 1 homolog isoform X3 n=1 Tax=Ostrinia furnacalis TaxID=93504 RepID=UPI00103CF64D|nr:required for meiotic nuclear division protein 1 homolog isoform X3 [Ostrinia furnacalis]XP_028159125.1 required for meiotic nuclear division protein 1 homolog isoform X5 [Ostrinia furnacalis]